jgi:hypothetical protein
MTPANLQDLLDHVFDSCKEFQTDDVLPILKNTIVTAGLESPDRHTVYGWAEEISAGVRPRA